MEQQAAEHQQGTAQWYAFMCQTTITTADSQTLDISIISPYSDVQYFYFYLAWIQATTVLKFTW